MKIGITLPHIGPNASKENILKIALDAEKGGFDSVWVAERLLWPLKPQTPFVVLLMAVFLQFIKMCLIL